MYNSAQKKEEKFGRNISWSSLDIIREIKPRSMRWSGHVARIGGMKNAYKI
jgi:hypothetical protein